MEKKFIEFFHVSEHVDYFKAIKVFSLRKKPEITGKVWSGGTPPPLFGKTPNFFRFFLMKVSLIWKLAKCFLYGKKNGNSLVVFKTEQLISGNELPR